MSSASEGRDRNVSSGFFVLRTPLLPFDELLAFGANSNGGRAELRERLARLLERPEIREALYVASPAFYRQLGTWLKTPDTKKGRAVECALVRYFYRMAGRATPFGLFSGSSSGSSGTSTRIDLQPMAEYRRHTRFDMHYLCALTRELELVPEIREGLRYRPNSGLYRAAGRIRYPESRFGQHGLSYHLVSVEPTEYLEATLDRAEGGATADDLAHALVGRDDEIPAEDARAYIDALIESQILVSDLTPIVTGPEPVHGLLSTLRSNPNANEMRDCLERATSGLCELDDGRLTNAPEDYAALARDLGRLPAPVDKARLFQVDMVKPATASLDAGVLDEFRRGAELLRRLPSPGDGDAFADFREAFRQRYDDREVPLVEVLDDDVGIGYRPTGEPAAAPAPLLKGISFPPATGAASTEWGLFHVQMLQKLIERSTAGEREVRLTEADIEAMEVLDPEPAPHAYFVMGALAARSQEALDEGDFKVSIRWAVGPSGARILGRFCHSDPQLLDKVRKHLRDEESADTGPLYAEIVHLPEGRLGNVLLRPVLREYEIPYLARSGAPSDRQIPLTDLLVSLQGNRVVLRSRRLGREVIPRLTTAHSYWEGGLAPYRFLGMLQGQITSHTLGWDWGPFHTLPFLPRISYGKIVLQRARWRVSKAEIDALRHRQHDGRFEAFRALRARRKMPRFVALAESDNELPVDLENPLSVDALFDLIGKRPEALLVEMFPAPDELCATGPEGRFVHELVIPFVVPASSAKPVVPAPRAVTSLTEAGSRSLDRPVMRLFAPGSEWLYAKLYCSPAVSDSLLKELVEPLVRRVTSSGESDSWFFLRYVDPQHHLRLRLHGDAASLAGEVLPALNEAVRPYLDDGRISSLQLDTYARELERYGGPEGMVASEQLFHADSEAVLALVRQTAGEASADLRWQLALLGLDMLVTDLEFDSDGRLRLLRQLRDSFAREFRIEKATRIQLGNRFRQERQRLEATLFPQDAGQDELHEARATLRRRSEQLVPVARRLRNLERGLRLTVTASQLASSFLHMHVNRLLHSNQRPQEFVLYDFLVRLYESRAAREARRPRTATAC